MMPGRVIALPGLDPAHAALECEILAGFANRHLIKHHRPQTIASELAAYREFREFAGGPLWTFAIEQMDRYGAALVRAGKARETIRRKQGVVRRLLDYARNPAYPWAARCRALTASEIPQICTPENTLVHQWGAPTTKRRTFTDGEIDRLDALLRRRIRDARRGIDSLAAATGLALFAGALAFGPRANELRMADAADLPPAGAESRTFSAFESLVVRFGKSHDGKPPKRRVVPAIYLLRGALDVLAWYLREVRPLLVRAESGDAVFLNAWGRRFRPEAISRRFALYRNAAGLSRELTFHCLRHTFETTLRAYGLDLPTIAQLLGHDQERTTLLYDHRGLAYVQARLRVFRAQVLARCRAA